MAADPTNTDNYKALSAGNKTLVDTAITAIKAAYAGVSGTEQKFNVYAIMKEQIETQEES